MSLDDVVAWPNLMQAFWRAALGKRAQPEVAAFAADLERNLGGMRARLLDGTFPFGRCHQFVVHDPKRRVISAPVFAERVAHHALIACIGPVLDRSLIADTFACRQGLGPIAAARRVQQQLARHPWFGSVDIRRFFDSVDHAVLQQQFRRRLKDAALLALCDRVVESFEVSPGRGLPIGALTSQHFANFHLGVLDRFLTEELRVLGYVRYMDDLFFCCADRGHARTAAAAVAAFAAATLRLCCKPAVVQRSRIGLTFCGFRLDGRRMRLSRRRRRRYVTAREQWERLYAAGLVDDRGLQQGYACALATTVHADAVAFRRSELLRRPPPDA